jgi:DNA replication licensing factor MCM4
MKQRQHSLNRGAPMGTGSSFSYHKSNLNSPMADPSPSSSQPTQEGDSQIHIDDHFGSSGSRDAFTSSLLADPSSYVSQTVAYGTNINLPAVTGEIRKFFQTFIEEEDSDSPLYLDKIRDMQTLQNYNLNLDCAHLRRYNPSLYRQFVAFPFEMVQISDSVAKEIYQSLYPTHEPTGDIQVRPFNLDEVHTIRSLSPSDIDRLVAVRGMVTRTSSVIPELTDAALCCRQCGRVELVHVANGRVSEPSKCHSCGSANSFDVSHTHCIFTDRQHVKLQESPEAIPQGETPQTLNCVVFEDLVDYARPGDRIEATGIWRASPARVNPRIRTLNAVYRTYVDVVDERKQFTTRIGRRTTRARAGASTSTSTRSGGGRGRRRLRVTRFCTRSSCARSHRRSGRWRTLSEGCCVCFLAARRSAGRGRYKHAPGRRPCDREVAAAAVHAQGRPARSG